VLRRVKRRTAEDRLRAGNKWVSTGYVFVTEFGDPCDPRNALRALQSAAQAAGLPQVGLHTIRHTAATVMLENGVQMKVVSEILGHAESQSRLTSTPTFAPTSRAVPWTDCLRHSASWPAVDRVTDRVTGHEEAVPGPLGTPETASDLRFLRSG
jgi:integrase